MKQKYILGLALLVFLLLAANVVQDTTTFMNLKSAALVLGGALMSVCLAYSPSTMRELFKALKDSFGPVNKDMEGLVKKIERLAYLNRRSGVKAMENELADVENLYLKKGAELILDGYDRFDIRMAMEKEYELFLSRRESLHNIMNTLTRLTPAFGFVGTIIGLINVLGNMDSSPEIGKGMALALLTTFYGLLFSNFLFLPLSRKLVEKTREEGTIQNIILEGIVAIAEDKNSKAISYRLHSYLSLEAPTVFEDKYKGAGLKGRLYRLAGILSARG